jgi:hypothetical protein
MPMSVWWHSIYSLYNCWYSMRKLMEGDTWKKAEPLCIYIYCSLLFPFFFSLSLSLTDYYITVIYIFSRTYTGEIWLKCYNIEFVIL